MDISRIESIIEQYVKNSPNASPKLFLDKIRKNLIVLMSQTDEAEILGKIDVFGGERAVAYDIGRAILNLFALARSLDVSLAPELNALSTKIEGQINATVRPDNGSAAAKPAPATIPDTTQKPASQSTATPSDDNSGSEDGVAKRIEMYTNGMNNAKGREEIAQIWKEVAADKLLKGPDKASLQGVKDEAIKRLQ
ncbi:MAG: hypothetical protein VST71_06590 [Nitrospirota bacterium]|nr:hypothetical protein [Nitrospirota bacterium]